MGRIFFVLVLFLISVAGVNSARILALSPFGTKSHTSGFEPLYFALGARGHHVTIVTNYIRSTTNPNIRYIRSSSGSKAFASFSNPFDGRLAGKALNAFDVTDFYESTCRDTYDNAEVMKLLNEDFDLIILNSFLSECSFGIVSQFPNAKIMAFSTLPLISWVSSIFGNPVTTSFTPLFVYGYTDRMTFFQRAQNFLSTIHYYYLRNYYHVPRMEAVYHSYFPDAPSVEEMDNKIELILIGSHPTVNYPRALFPNMVETSGLHCREGKPLPKDLQDFIDGSGEEGFIYFSMGSFLQGTQVPEKIRLAFVKVFSKLKQRVIWKYETEKMNDLPSNVKLGKWLPQQDILAQPTIRIFITHGGLLSMQEAVFHGVPLIGIPLFGDQDGNVELAYQRGVSLTQNLEEISEVSITEKITQILEDKRFKANAKILSTAFRDRPIPPLETSIFWTEYLLRHNASTAHLRSAGRDLNALKYHSLDVITLIIFITGTVFWILYYLIRCFPSPSQYLRIW